MLAGGGNALFISEEDLDPKKEEEEEASYFGFIPHTPPPPFRTTHPKEGGVSPEGVDARMYAMRTAAYAKGGGRGGEEGGIVLLLLSQYKNRNGERTGWTGRERIIRRVEVESCPKMRSTLHPHVVESMDTFVLGYLTRIRPLYLGPAVLISFFLEKVEKFGGSARPSYGMSRTICLIALVRWTKPLSSPLVPISYFFLGTHPSALARGGGTNGQTLPPLPPSPSPPPFWATLLPSVASPAI